MSVDHNTVCEDHIFKLTPVVPAGRSSSKRSSVAHRVDTTHILFLLALCETLPQIIGDIFTIQISKLWVSG
jgi:hypothetical protein